MSKSIKLIGFFSKDDAKFRQALLKFDFAKINVLIFIALSIYGFLNVLDVYSTILVLKNVPLSYEINPFVSSSFADGNLFYPLILKLSIFSMITFIVSLPLGQWKKMETRLRILKLGIMLGLLIEVPILALIVSKNFLIFLTFSE